MTKNINDGKDIVAFIAEAVIKNRHRIGLTQKELAYKSKLNETSIKQVESGKADPSVYTLYKITKALNIKLRQLVKGFL